LKKTIPESRKDQAEMVLWICPKTSIQLVQAKKIQ
jgi:hypothetical protein